MISNPEKLFPPNTEFFFRKIFEPTGKDTYNRSTWSYMNCMSIFHILIVKTLIDPIQMTDGAQRGLTAMEAKRLPLRSKRNWNPNRKSQNYFGIQIWKPISIFDENRKPSAKTRKSGNHNKHQNCKTEVCLAQNRKTDLKKMTNTAKPKIPIPPSLLILRY